MSDSPDFAEPYAMMAIALSEELDLCEERADELSFRIALWLEDNGFAIVPMKANDEMLSAGRAERDEGEGTIWQAMLQANPHWLEPHRRAPETLN